MKKRKWLALAMGLAALVAVGGFVATGSIPAVAEEQSAKDKKQSAKDKEQSAKDKEHPARERREQFIAAFNKGDAKAVAAFWTEDATYVDQVGHEYKGRAAIEKLYKKVFASRKGAKLAIHVTASKKVSPEVILNDGFTEVTPADGGPPTTARFSTVLVKKDGEWYLQSVRDSVAPPPSNGDHLEDLGWLIGEWAGESEKGRSGTATFQWAENENFIVSSFNTTLNGIPVYGGTQWIGWDAIDKRIRSWSFYSGGGFGRAVWTKDGKKWSIKTTAQTADGKKVSATNIVTKTDNDHMTWQMTKLTVDGKSLPDAKPQKLKRVQEPEE
jgi:uncharacterized protein (TIGR02246 family)